MLLALDPPGHDERLLKLERHGDIAFILPSKWHHAKYRRHYLENEHYIAMIDNGIYEGALQIELMQSIARELEQTGNTEMIVVVLPDVLRDMDATIKLQMKYAKKLERYQRMFVLQGNEPLKHYWMIESMIDNEDFVGIPIWMMREKGIWYRIRLAQKIEHHVHFLGLDNPLEALKASRIAMSVDTSLPYTLAKHNVLLGYEDYRLERITEEDELTDEQVALAGLNIVLLKALCYGAE